MDAAKEDVQVVGVTEGSTENRTYWSLWQPMKRAPKSLSSKNGHYNFELESSGNGVTICHSIHVS